MALEDARHGIGKIMPGNRIKNELLFINLVSVTGPEFHLPPHQVLIVPCNAFRNFVMPKNQ
jgi:hypothetical protein